MRAVVLALVAGCHFHGHATESVDAAAATADAAADATVLPTCDCPLGDGTYCATGVEAYESTHACSVAALAGHEQDVMHCAAGVWTVEAACAHGCYVAPDGTPDGCKATSDSYHLPWTCGVTYPVTQGNHGDICGSSGGDHTGTQDYPWDFGIPRHTALRATRAGTVTLAANVVGEGQQCYDGCTQPFGSAAFWQCCNACINTSNHVNVAHGDGTVSTYWHMDEVTVHTGQVVKQGDMLGYSGTSGCSSGPHLHFQVMGDCPSGYCQSVPIDFDEAGAPACGDNVTSRNACP